MKRDRKQALDPTASHPQVLTSLLSLGPFERSRAAFAYHPTTANMPPKVVYSARRTTEDPDNEAATQERSVESTARTDEGTEARLSGGGPAEETMEDIEADEVRSEVAVLEDEDEEDLEPAAAAREAFDPRAISDEQVEENEFARALARRGYAGLLKHAYRKSQEADRAITRDVPYKHFQAVGFEIVFSSDGQTPWRRTRSTRTATPS